MAKVNFPEKEKANVTRPCLVAACRGNENIADLLNYLIYEAQDFAEKKKVEASDIPLQLSHNKMLNRPNDDGKRFNFSERSLIGYLRRLDEWKLVTTGKYSHSQVVHIDAINKAIANPPEKPKGKPRGRQKSGNVEANKKVTKGSTFLSQENVELKKKVEILQQNVEMLQQKVEMFQDFVEKFQLSESAKAASQAVSEAKNRPLYTVDTIYSVDFFTGATFRSDDDDFTGPSPDKKNSYSQDIPTPTTDSSRLQENKAHQSIDILTSQESVTLPAKPAPIAEYKPEPPAPRLQTPAQIAQERKRIERHIWQLIDTAAGAKIGRSYTKPMEDLVTGYMDGEYLDEDFTQAVLLTKEKKQQLKFTNIVDNMADAALKRKKIIDFQTAATKKNNIDEEIEASRRAEKEFEAKERARKEQGKVFA